MKRLMTHCMFLLLLVTGTAMAKTVKPAVNDKNNTDTTAANSDVAAGRNIAELEAHPNPASGMLAVKTPCAGKVYFYSKRGKEKGECIVNEGVSMIDLSNLLFPGTYVCRFEGVNGSIAETRVVYKL